MSNENWAVYRHKKRPDIRYYVQMRPNGEGVQFLPGPPSEIVGLREYQVHLKVPKNVRFDTEDHPLHMAAEAGLWPYKRFMELYEEEDK